MKHRDGFTAAEWSKIKLFCEIRGDRPKTSQDVDNFRHTIANLIGSDQRKNPPITIELFEAIVAECWKKSTSSSLARP